jgi:hypothetical protein
MRLPTPVTLAHVAFAWMHLDDLEQEPQAALPPGRKEQARQRIEARRYARALSEKFKAQQEREAAEALGVDTQRQVAIAAE